MRVIANAGEYIGNLSLRARRVTNPIRGQQRKFQTTRNLDDRMIARFFFTIEMTLQLGINIFSAEDVDELLCDPLCPLCVSVANYGIRRTPCTFSLQFSSRRGDAGRINCCVCGIEDAGDGAA